MKNLISQSELERYLWGAAELLRGQIDASDYKQFIFPLMFYKRLCDVYDEEYALALAESDGDEAYAAFAENHRFQIPAEAHWQGVRETTQNVGQAIQSALRSIETANADKLLGIFGDAPWTNKNRLPDALLIKLMDHFASQQLTLERVPQDQLGNAYEYLIKKFADDSGHTAAEFYTNRTVVHLMTQLVNLQSGESIYDPSCGSGGMLLNAILELKQQGKEYRNIKAYGQEINLLTSAIARMNLFLHDLEEFEIYRGDTLANPGFIENDKLKQFDVILANPPYSISRWNRDAFTKDAYGRNLYGTPPQGNADYAFFQHILVSLDDTKGRSAILYPNGVLFRDAEAQMRQGMIEDDLFEGVIGLGPNLFYNSGMEACIVILSKNKPKHLKGKIILVNAIDEIYIERNNAYLTEEHQKKIVDAYQNPNKYPEIAKTIDISETKAKDFKLHLPFYFDTKSEQQVVTKEDVQACIRDWQASREEVITHARALLSNLKSVGLS